MLRDNNEAIGWTTTDIKGLSSSTEQHCIHLIEEAIPKCDLQRRLNPIMQEVVRVKILNNGIICPNSQWVSHIHVVPKRLVL